MNDFQLYIGVSARFNRELDAVLAQLGEGVKEDWLDVMSEEFRLFFYTDTGRLAMYVPETVPSYTVTLTIVLERMRGAFRSIQRDRLLRLITFSLDERVQCHKYPEVARNTETLWYRRFLFALMDSHHGSYYMGYSSEELHAQLVRHVKIFETVVAAFNTHGMGVTDRRIRMLHEWLRIMNNNRYGVAELRLRELFSKPGVFFEIMDYIRTTIPELVTDDSLSNMLQGWLNEGLLMPAEGAVEEDLILMWDICGIPNAECPFSEPHKTATLDSIWAWQNSCANPSLPLTWLWQHSDAFYGKPMEVHTIASDIIRALQPPEKKEELEEKFNAGTV